MGTTKTEPAYIVSKTDAITLQVFDSETHAPVQDTNYGVLNEELVEDGMCSSHACADLVNRDFFNFMEVRSHPWVQSV